MSEQFDEMNAKRCIAAEIIVQLWEAGEVAQIELLSMQIEASLKHPYIKHPEAKPHD